MGKKNQTLGDVLHGELKCGSQKTVEGTAAGKFHNEHLKCQLALQSVLLYYL